MYLFIDDSQDLSPLFIVLYKRGFYFYARGISSSKYVSNSAAFAPSVILNKSTGGPTRPMNIHSMIKLKPNVLNDPVPPIDKPTVPRALTTSNKSSFISSDSPAICSIKVTREMVINDKIIVAIDLALCFRG